jgi:RIO kinase 1
MNNPEDIDFRFNIQEAVEDRAWLKHEFRTMQELYNAGADVPEPFELSGNTILMEFIGDAQTAAPLLQEILLDLSEAQPLFDRCIKNIEILLSFDSIHGDLSAFNILYWNDAITLIDFPQAVDPFDNPSAFSILARDVERICQYFPRYGIQPSPVDIASDLWRRCIQREL